MWMRLTVCLVLGLVAFSLADDQPSFSQEVLDAMDTSVDPCDNFYQYACGGWVDAHPLPSDKSRYSRTFTVIADRNKEILTSLLEDPENGKVNVFYESCMNMDVINAKGNTPIDKLFVLADSVMDNRTFIEAIGQLHSFGIPALFELAVDLDAKDPAHYVSVFYQGGMALPDRSLYIDADSEQVRKDYVAHMTRMFEMTGMSNSDASIDALAVLSVEKRLALASLPSDELIDPFQLYNMMTIAELQELSPAFPWSFYFARLNRDDVTKANIVVPTFFAKLSQWIAPLDVPTLRAYLRWHLLHWAAPFLPQSYVDEDFYFFQQVLYGISDAPSRSRTCADLTDRLFGDITGILFAEVAFSDASLRSAEILIHMIEKAMSDDLYSLDWMDETTLQGAIYKMEKLTNLVGYPSNPKNYETVYVDVDSLMVNVIEAESYNFQKEEASRIERDADPSQWLMTADEVNAYYEPSRNQMVFPAGILQPPFFSEEYPWSMNFGGIGMVMGHENTHGFDNQGSSYTGDGVLENWWAPETRELFQERVDCVIAQYSSYEVLPGVYVNGNLTQGENIADMGGIKLAMNAFLRVLEIGSVSPLDPSPVPGLNNIQLFFTSFAQGWCATTSDEYLTLQVKTDPHSPSMFRVIGPLQNTPEFAEAFSCKAGSFMAPEDRCEVW